MSERLTDEERLSIGERICWECAPRNVWAEVEHILTERVAVAKAEAWDECLAATLNSGPTRNPYRDREQLRPVGTTRKVNA